MKVHIVCYEDVHGWILGKFALKLQEHLRPLGVAAKISKQPDPQADINHHIIYYDYDGRKTTTDTVMVTHIDTNWKSERLGQQLVNAAMGICMSAETVDNLTAAGLPREKLCFVNPGHDGEMRARRTIIGITSKVQPSGCKREGILLDLAQRLSPEEFQFRIMGAGWDDHVKQLRLGGFTVDHWPAFDRPEYLKLMPSLDYYLYFGLDEGSMGYMDALAAGVQTIVTKQGFHLDAPGGITHGWSEPAELFRIFEGIAREKRLRQQAVANWNWPEYAKRHLALWKYLLAKQSGDPIPAALRAPLNKMAVLAPDGTFAPIPNGALTPQSAAGAPVSIPASLMNDQLDRNNPARPAYLPLPGGESRGRGENVTASTASRPRILLVADVPNWIFARHCAVLMERLGSQFDFDLKLQGQTYNEADYDLIYPLEWYLIPQNQIRTPAKYVTSIRSHTSWAGHDFLGFTQFLNTNFQRIHTVSQRLTRVFSPFVPHTDYVTHGTDTQFFSPTRPVKQSESGRVRVGWAGNRVNKTKGFEELIAPLGKLPGVELVFCGYMDKNLDLEGMRRFYNSIDVYVCSSAQEGNNNSLLEAASMERAILTTDNGTVPEYLQHRHSALIVERELPLLIQAVCELRDDPKLRRSLGLQARQSVIAQFDWKQMAPRYAEFFIQALKSIPTWQPKTEATQSSVQLRTPRSAKNHTHPPTPTAPTRLVSVIIPCYKQAEFLGEAVESVNAQTYSNWEIIIVNDGSPDDTSAVAQSLILQHPTRTIRLIEKANGGLADARNAGIRFARGDFVLPLDADDKIDPTFLAKTVALLEQNPKIAIAYTDWVYFGAYTRNRAAIDYDFKRMCTKENLFTCTSLFRRKAWEVTRGYNPNMTKGAEDWDFWISCGEKGFIGQRISEPLFFYRAKDVSMIHTLQPHLPAMFARIILNHPKLYGAEAVRLAQKKFDAAQLPPPKASSPGEEWQPPTTTLADFSKIIADAEALVRAARLGDAIALVEQGLRQAPTAECATRAREILDLLRAELKTAPAPEAAEASTSFSDKELFGPDEVEGIQQIITAYSNAQTDPALRNQLVELQHGLMNLLVTAEPEKLEGHFFGSLGRVFRALIKSGLSSESPSEALKAQCAVLDEAIAAAETAAGAFDVRPLLARILCTPAHRGSVTVAVEKIPAWFIEDYLGYVLFAPPVFVAAGEAEDYRAHLLAWSRAIRQLTRTQPSAPLTNKVAHFFAMRASYIPLYFSHSNTRELAENRAAIMEFVLARNGAAIEAKFPKRAKPRGKIKVGYVSAHFGAQTETHVTLPSLQLDRSKFEICLFPVATNPGPVEDHCRSFADSFTPLPKELPRQVKTIRDAALDVVIIGTNVTAVTNQVSLIALHRLAPLQLASYCSPVSTGMRHIDGYLSGTLNDHPGLQEHFSEKLYFCEGPPGCLDYTVESPGSGKTFDRAGLGLADDDVVFVNAAACFKILPEMQETWAKILAAVPKSRLLLLPFNPNWSNAFPVKQFERTLTEACARHGVGRERFILVGSLPTRAEVKALERVADVYLDTSPFSGSISVIDPLELGLPLVVQEGATHRSRMASALLRELKLPEMITTDEAAYIALAQRLGTDTTYRRQLNERILAAVALRPKFINAQAYARGLGALLESLVRVK
jgi:predicted O-linked N-acetylglucosamine transferase (SPINDLY family)/glycosyltransferase involved in cell wall biosynthesis